MNLTQVAGRLPRGSLDGRMLRDLDGWRLARSPLVAALVAAEDIVHEACALLPDQVFAVLADGTLLQLDTVAGMGALGRRLHDGLSPDAYAQALARLHPVGRPDPSAKVVRELADVGPEFASRGISAVEPARAWRTATTVTLSFWARHSTGLDRWWVEAPQDSPARWETAPGYRID